MKLYSQQIKDLNDRKIKTNREFEQNIRVVNEKIEELKREQTRLRNKFLSDSQQLEQDTLKLFSAIEEQ